jgi:hypothetical protein
VKVHSFYTEALPDWMILGDLDRLEAALPKVVEVAGAWGWLAVGCLSQALLWKGDFDAALDRAKADTLRNDALKIYRAIGMPWFVARAENSQF